jgi:DNA polymerase-4
MASERVILHVDMDAFFASVEQLDDPRLRGLPVLVGHDGARGVVAAASYEARRFGCHSAQPMVVAKRLCPQAVVVHGRFERYREISRQVHAIFERMTSVVEPVSIDEAYLDVTGSLRLLGTGEEMGRRLKEMIRAETGLTASVGVAGNKFLAKLASDMRKPDGLVVIGAEDVERILPGMAVGRIHGIGKKTEESLASAGVKTVGDLRRMPREWVEGRRGRWGAEVLERAFGRDMREVVPDRETKSISHEQTFGVDVGEPEAVREVLREQVEAVAWRVRRQGLFARRVGLKIRFGDFQTISRSRTLAAATDRTDLLMEGAMGAFEEWAKAAFRPVRLIGRGAEELTVAEAGQMALFGREEEEKARGVDKAVDAINTKFGKGVIRRGG